MSNYRRALVPGGTYFFTVVTENRAPILCDPVARTALRASIRSCRDRWPFQIDAMVLLPDHLHTIWSMPSGDSAFPTRWAWIKKEFTRSWIAAGGEQQPTSPVRQRYRRRGVWQRGYWEHSVRDETDLERHADYIHYNPVKHGLVACPADWPYSTFRRWVRLGTYPSDWGCGKSGPMLVEDLTSTAPE